MSIEATEPSRVDVLEQKVADLEAGLVAQAQKHDELVRELQVLINQAMAVDPARAQQIRQRAVRIARLRNAQNATP